MNSVVPNTSIKKPRNTNLELFRIITMLLIVAHHYVVNSGLMGADGPIYSELWSWRSMFLLLFGAWGKTGINCFVLITGYFMCKSQISAKKFMKLLLELEFYKIAIYLIFVISGYSNFSLAGLAKAIIPFTSIRQNFPGCFLMFFLTIPFLNILVNNMKEKQHIRLVLLLGFIYIILGTLLGSNIIMNYITWFTVLYLVASYIRIYPKRLFGNTKLWGLLALASFVISALSVVALNYIKSHYNILSPYSLLTDSNKALAFFTAFCAFMFFKNANIKYSKFINTIAASAFGVLLIHSNSSTMRQWLWSDILKNVEMYDSNFLILHAVLSVISIYAICTIIDYLRIRFIEKPFFKLWDKLWNKILTQYIRIENYICNKLGIKN